jgi:hypothetical protein
MTEVSLIAGWNLITWPADWETIVASTIIDDYGGIYGSTAGISIISATVNGVPTSCVWDFSGIGDCEYTISPGMEVYLYVNGSVGMVIDYTVGESTSLHLVAGLNTIVWQPLWLGTTSRDICLDYPTVVSISRTVLEPGEPSIYDNLEYAVGEVLTWQCGVSTTDVFVIHPGDVVDITVSVDTVLDYTPPVKFRSGVTGIVWPAYWPDKRVSVFCNELVAVNPLAKVYKVSKQVLVNGVWTWTSYIPGFSTPGSTYDFLMTAGLFTHVVTSAVIIYGIDATTVPTVLTLECAVNGSTVSIDGQLLAYGVGLQGQDVQLYIDGVFSATLQTDWQGNYATDRVLTAGTHAVLVEFDGVTLEGVLYF